MQTTWGMGLLGVSNSKKTSMAAGGGEKGWTEMRLEWSQAPYHTGPSRCGSALGFCPECHHSESAKL